MRKQRVTSKSPTEKPLPKGRLSAPSPLLVAWHSAKRSEREQLLRHVFGMLAGEAVIAMMRAARARVAADPVLPKPSNIETRSIDEFLATCMQLDTRARINADHLHRLFCAFAQARQLQPLSRILFSREMQGRGFQRKRSSMVYWLGLRPKISEVPFTEAK